MSDVRNIEEYTFTDHRGNRHQVRCEELVNGGWQYVINNALRGDNFYRSGSDAYGDAVDMLIVLSWRGTMTGENFFSLITAMDASLAEGYAAVDALGRDSGR
jgi:hypothetical protein